MLWHDYLVSIIDTNFGKNGYKVIKTDQMVGLFSCIFIKAGLEHRIRQCDSNVVKTGFRLMNKSLHGNKGGIATRLVIDDTSLCFVNCHLAAGQSNVLTRNVDIEGILHSARFPSCAVEAAFKPDVDGTSILDHETCFLSGDLNYRIGMKRDQVLALLADGNSKFEAWETLQQEDQLKKQLAFNPMFRMLGFKEPPLLFDPTYKYDRATDFYDSSEKKRTPAWCDRILHRGPTSLSNLYYRRHELKASDHRPISAGFTIHAKTVDRQRLEQVKARLQLEWQQVLANHTQLNKVLHVTRYDLCGEKEALHRLEKANWSVEQVVKDLYRDKGPYFV
ncbi:Endonuclease/exonuclease/phosphatase [Parasitella parasitica]|nr:Endonuclease/exonuclease/phosphatase [Parasitella parasitica]